MLHCETYYKMLSIYGINVSYIIADFANMSLLSKKLNLCKTQVILSVLGNTITVVGLSEELC